VRSALEKSKFTDWFFRILTNDRDILGLGRCCSADSSLADRNNSRSIPRLPAFAVTS